MCVCYRKTTQGSDNHSASSVGTVLASICRQIFGDKTQTLVHFRCLAESKPIYLCLFLCSQNNYNMCFCEYGLIRGSMKIFFIWLLDGDLYKMGGKG